MSRMPTFYIPHGGGPWPFVDLGGFLPAADVAVLRGYLERLPASLSAPPRALLAVSAHWEEPQPTVMTLPRPPLLFDYYGFPPEAYTLTWPAPGDADLARRTASLLEQAGFATAEDPERGFDHGTFVPLKVSWPRAEVPTVQLSLKIGLDPGEHLAMGRALAPLRDEGVLILGSGMSFHNLRAYGTPAGRQASLVFDAWLGKAGTAPSQERERLLKEWAAAPGARQSHPREEHLLPLMVAAGAAGEDAGAIDFNADFMGTRITSLRFG